MYQDFLGTIHAVQCMHDWKTRCHHASNIETLNKRVNPSNKFYERLQISAVKFGTRTNLQIFNYTRSNDCIKITFLSVVIVILILEKKLVRQCKTDKCMI